MTAEPYFAKATFDMYCGAWMKGGEYASKEMLMLFALFRWGAAISSLKGNVFDYCGASYRGDWRGMKGGNIVVNGTQAKASEKL